jgi:NAD(P)H-hydrate epimerase
MKKMEILTVNEMREVERLADAAGLSYAQMMQNAGRNAAHEILFRLTPARALVLAGPGNNGGDGLVCAATLRKAGVHVDCMLLKPRSDEDAVFAAAKGAGVPMHTPDALAALLSQANVVVDALLGTGVSRPIEGTLREVLLAVKRSGITVVALDGPTGMNYDTGALDEAAVPAALTITFHAPKRGHFCFPAAEARGELAVVSIGAERLAIGDWRLKIGDSRLEIVEHPDKDDPNAAENANSTHSLYSLISNLVLANDDLARFVLPARKLDSNKGSHGKTLVIGGCSDYFGAPTLTARAAYRAGAGLVAMAVPQAIQHMAAMLCAEATFVPLPESHNAHNIASLPRLVQWLHGVKEGAAIALGPGMGQSDDTANFIDALLASSAIHAVPLKGLLCDADALNHLSRIDKWHERLPALTVLTPHAGEMARLTGLSIADVQTDRIGIALKFAEAWNHIVVLKGAYTVIAAPAQRGIVLPFSNPAMATAGTGDVLAGCIVGLMAQGLSAFDAAVCGAYLHGRAGDAWRSAHGDAGLLASDLLPLLPDQMHALKLKQT